MPTILLYKYKSESSVRVIRYNDDHPKVLFCVYKWFLFFSSFQLGIALGFLLPPLMVHNSDNLRDISSSLSRMFYGFAIFSTVIFILIFFCKYAVDNIVVIVMCCFHKRYVVECRSFLCIDSCDSISAIATELGTSESKVGQQQHQRPQKLHQVLVAANWQLRVCFVATFVRHERRVVLCHFHAPQWIHIEIFPGKYPKTKNCVVLIQTASKSRRVPYAACASAGLDWLGLQVRDRQLSLRLV